MASPPRDRLGGDLVRLAHRGLGVPEFSLAAARRLARTVPFDGVCVLTMDPATLTPTVEVVENGLPPEARAWPRSRWPAPTSTATGTVVSRRRDDGGWRIVLDNPIG